MSEFVPEPLPQGWEHWPQDRQQAFWATRKAARAAWENGGPMEDFKPAVPAPVVMKYEPAPKPVNPPNGGGDAYGEPAPDLGGEAPKTPRKRKAKEGDGGTFDEKLALREPPKFPVIAWDNITFGLIAEWLLKRVLPRKGVVVFYGVSGATKTFVLLDILLHIALGWKWAGRYVKQASVIFIAAEASEGLRKRKTGWVEAHKNLSVPADVPFDLIEVAPNLGTGEDDCKKISPTLKRPESGQA
jgi:hypothetical protein